MGFMDKAKAAAEQAATKARSGVEDVQTKRELSQAYSELGREAYALIAGGEISHPKLAPIAERIRAAEAGSETSAATTAPSEPAQPPAMPT